MSDSHVYRVISVEDFLDDKGNPVHREEEINVYTLLSSAKSMRTRKLRRGATWAGRPDYTRDIRIESSPLVWTTVVV